MKRFSLSAVLLAALLLCGCTDISNRVLSPAEQEANDSYVPGVGGELLIIETDEEGESEPVSPGAQSIYEFSPQQESFIASCLFMGDSICSGIGAYGFSPRCYAKAGVAARNILEFTFDYDGYQVGPLTALVNSGASNLVFLMGTNDVNLVSAEEYASYYDDFLSKVEASCPGVNIYVVSVTPITADCDFCYNYQLDGLNTALKEMIERNPRTRRYIDAATLLKDEDGSLKETFSAGDGIHLSRTAYYAMLHALCEGAGIQ